MTKPSHITTRRIGFRDVEVGEFFMYKDGDPYVKIKVQQPMRLTDDQRAQRRKRDKGYRYENPLEYVEAALNLRTMETNYDCSGGDLACCRINGHVTVEAHDGPEQT